MTGMARALATGFGLGHLPGAPGTWASAATIPLVWGLHWLGGFWLVLPLTFIVIWGGLWACAQILKGPDDDPSEVVIDEIAGMMIALWPLSLGMSLADAPPHVFPWPGWVAAFVLFRIFDILKPPPVDMAERVGGPVGVMLDDIVAGMIAAALGVLAAGVAHGWIL
ncbi:MAG: phosphatidylglycerophosphatase A [Pseudomonadota bacterium]